MKMVCNQHIIESNTINGEMYFMIRIKLKLNAKFKWAEEHNALPIARSEDVDLTL